MSLDWKLKKKKQKNKKYKKYRFGHKCRSGILTESSKSPPIASIAKSNKQWVGTCLYQEACSLSSTGLEFKVPNSA